ncbi:hypothetical protein E3E14_25315 [Streptomyces sp. ICN441]|uniref:hypothetical protein n=1 Tax=Streptomyces sp. ICN441 TaxID=2558286 RepID=UPI00106917D8|nr:hypothetical protein [Streptomyces sp. ICN441]TFE42506.1 hypothetical protein E3E14_25315 [Streptomyces sp. ICN441]
MAFPDSTLDVRTELLIGVVWTDITDDVYTRSPITIERGRKDEGTRTDPTKVSLQLNNRLGKYSPRNPLSPYYGLIGRNTPIRVSVPGPESYLALTGETADIASTPDTAALDITGDIDVRVEATTDWWSSTPQVLIGKWGADGQRSWMVRIYQGQLRWIHTPDGTTASQRFANWVLPALPRRAALRVTVDVDNGSGGWSPSLYWAESLDGPWTLVDALVGAAPTTSIHNSTAPLAIAPEDPTTTPPRVPLRGRVHRAEVRSGIGGTVVASPDFRGKAEGTTSFADSAGRTWTLAGAATITDREYRAYAEVSSWPARWDISGEDVYVPIEAAGIGRRLGQGKKPLASTLRRRVPSGGPLAYWPLEEGKDATRAYSPVPDVTPLTLQGFDFAAEDTLPGSSALPKLKNPAKLRGSIPRSTASGWHVEMVYKLDTMPASQTEIMRVTVASSTMRTAVVYASTAGIRVEAQDSTGDILAFFLFTNATAIGDFTGVWNRLAIFTSDASGGTTRLTANWRDISAGGGTWTASTIYTGAQGAAVGVAGDWAAATEGMVLGHLAAFDTAGSSTTPGVTIYESADDGFTGESALARLDRLSQEQGLDLVWVDGDATRPSELMGPQRPAPVLDLLEEVPATDGGILYEHRERLGMVYRDRTSMENQPVALALDYLADGEVGPPLDPVEDDQAIRNDITVKRDGGSEGRAVLESGPMSVLPPEEGGIGPVEESVTLSLALDTQAQQIAGWRLGLGTWDEARYPTVHVMLHAAPHLIPDVLAMDLGDRLTIANPPAWLPPETIDQLAQGYTEILDQYTWDLWFNCTPAGPWTVGVLEDAVLGRLDTDGAILSAAASSSDTALEVHTDTAVGPRWIDSAGYPSMFPFEVKAGGERATCTAITNRTDSFTRSVSNSWGTATSGQVWTEVGGAASDRSVNGSRGVITLAPSVSTIRFQRLVATHVADAEVRVRLSASAVATGASAVPGVLLRYVDTSNFYRARLHFGTGGNLFLSVTRDTTQIGSSPAAPYTYSAGAEFEFRVRLVGHTMQLKTWPVGQAEPNAWQHTETVVTGQIAAGGIGVTGSAFSGLTNVGLELRYDQFEIVTPQLMTVTRSVNGISKAHPAGTPVSLATPMRTAL